jgi:hypothetical protein
MTDHLVDQKADTFFLSLERSVFVSSPSLKYMIFSGQIQSVTHFRFESYNAYY